MFIYPIAADMFQVILKEILELHERGGLGDGSPPAGSRGGAPVEGLGEEVPQKLKHLVTCSNKFSWHFEQFYAY